MELLTLSKVCSACSCVGKTWRHSFPIGIKCWPVLPRLLTKVFLKPCFTNRSRLARPFNMTWKSIIEPMKEPARKPTSFLFQPSDATLTVRGLKRIEIGLPKAFQVLLQQSSARQASFQRGTVWPGTREAVVRTTAHTSMKPQSQETTVLSRVRQGSLNWPFGFSQAKGEGQKNLQVLKTRPVWPRGQVQFPSWGFSW